MEASGKGRQENA
ncbi:rCG32434, partial [Rattus norvegicus]